MVKKLRLLESQAEIAARNRGHKLGAFETITDVSRLVSHAHCKVCSGYVQVDTAPPPNGIDIGGDAVALNCPIQEEPKNAAA